MAGRIEDYAIVGDMQSVALIGTDGSVDWLCLPRFDSEACFAALLGTDNHGHWRIAPGAGAARATRRYAGDTLILETNWETPDGAVRVTDFMPPRDDDEPPVLVRIVTGVRGTVEMNVTLRVRFGYGSIVPWLTQIKDGVRATAGPDGTGVPSRKETTACRCPSAASNREQPASAAAAARAMARAGQPTAPARTHYTG